MVGKVEQSVTQEPITAVVARRVLGNRWRKAQDKDSDGRAPENGDGQKPVKSTWIKMCK
jgi:hypothetical protein